MSGDQTSYELEANCIDCGTIIPAGQVRCRDCFNSLRKEGIPDRLMVGYRWDATDSPQNWAKPEQSIGADARKPMRPEAEVRAELKVAEEEINRLRYGGIPWAREHERITVLKWVLREKE